MLITPTVTSWVELLEYRALQTPDHLIYRFLENGEAPEVTLTYSELSQQARRVGAFLQSLTRNGDRVLILMPNRLSFMVAFLGCLYAGVVAVPTSVPRRSQALARLLGIVADVSATVVLTDRATLEHIQQILAENPALSALSWVVLEDLPQGVEHGWQMPGIGHGSLAFLQYTSGSTGNPKGVMVSHGNLLHNIRAIQAAFAHTPTCHIVSWLPFFHDWGLIGGLLQPLYVGIGATIFDPTAFLRQPVRWLRAISRYRATISGAPNFAYELLLRLVTREQCTGLDLSTWEVAIVGAEPIRADTLERFSDFFGPYGFRKDAFLPCYGLAEGTLMVTGGHRTAAPVFLQRPEATPLVGCGPSLLDQTLLIVDPETAVPVGLGQVGEVWLQGPSVAQGYWRSNQAYFQAQLQDGQGPFLRTGDLGFLIEGELFITGRLKDLIILGGRNHYPQDLERAVEQSHPGLRPDCGAAFGITVDGEERLVIVQEVGPRERGDWEKIIGGIQLTLAQTAQVFAHTILIVKPGSIPKTSSGKVMRRACRDLFLQQSLPVLAVWTAPLV